MLPLKLGQLVLQALVGRQAALHAPYDAPDGSADNDQVVARHVHEVQHQLPAILLIVELKGRQGDLCAQGVA